MTEETQITPLQARIAEVAQYEANIALYKNILLNLPTEWPERLLEYRGAKNQHDLIAKVDNEDVELLSKLWYADDCAKAVKTETLEMTKAKSILNVLQP
jgi:translation initiation factor RLI1